MNVINVTKLGHLHVVHSMHQAAIALWETYRWFRVIAVPFDEADVPDLPAVWGNGWSSLGRIKHIRSIVVRTKGCDLTTKGAQNSSA